MRACAWCSSMRCRTTRPCSRSRAMRAPACAAMARSPRPICRSRRRAWTRAWPRSSSSSLPSSITSTKRRPSSFPTFWPACRKCAATCDTQVWTNGKVSSVASPIICRSALAIEAHRGVASLANTLCIGKRCALRCAPMTARSLRHLIRHATLAHEQIGGRGHRPHEQQVHAPEQDKHRKDAEADQCCALMVAGFADHTKEHEIDQNRNRQDGLDLFASLLGKPDSGEGRDNADGDAYQEEQRGANQGFLVHLPVLLLVRLRMK